MRVRSRGWGRSARALAAATALAAFVPLYVEYVYERDLVEISISSYQWNGTQLWVAGYLFNRGTRPVVVEEIEPEWKTGFGFGERGLRDRSHSTPLPIVLQATQIYPFSALVAFDPRKIRDDPQNKAVRFECRFYAYDAWNESWLTFVKLETRSFAPGNSLEGQHIEGVSDIGRTVRFVDAVYPFGAWWKSPPWE